MTTTSLFTAQTIDFTGLNLQPGVAVDFLSTPNLANAGGNYMNSLRMSCKYSALDPVLNGPGSWEIGCRIDHLIDPNSNRWVPFHYQFSSFQVLGTAPERILEMQPNYTDFNLGIDDITFIVGSEVARTSRQPGSVPRGDLRVCWTVKDNDPAGPNAIKSLVIDADIELFNAGA